MAIIIAAAAAAPFVAARRGFQGVIAVSVVKIAQLAKCFEDSVAYKEEKRRSFRFNSLQFQAFFERTNAEP